MNNATARKRTQITIGLDLGDRRHTYFVLDEAGKTAREGSLGNTREQLATMARSYPGATVVMEAGTHSPWVSRFLQELGLRVIVANPRKGSIRSFVFRAGLFFFVRLRFCRGAVAPSSSPRAAGLWGRVAPIP